MQKRNLLLIGGVGDHINRAYHNDVVASAGRKGCSRYCFPLEGYGRGGPPRAIASGATHTASLGDEHAFVLGCSPRTKTLHRRGKSCIRLSLSPLFPFQFPILKRKTIGTVFPSPTCSHSPTISLAEPLVVALSSFAFPDNPDSSPATRSPFPSTDYAGGDDTQQKEVRWTDGWQEAKQWIVHTHTQQ